MIWLTLALKNLLRRPVRTLLTLSGVAIAIAVFYALAQFERGYESNLRGELNRLGAHVLVVPKGCPYEAATIVLHGGKWPRYMKEEYLTTVRNVPGVEQTAGIIMDAIIDPTGAANRIYVGIDEDYPRLRPSWKLRGTWFPDSNAVILGATVAALEHKQPGDLVTIPGKDRVFRVSGVLERTGSQDDGFYFLPRHAMQRAFNLEGKLVAIMVRVRDVNKVDELTTRLKLAEPNMNVFPLSQLLATITRLVANTKVFVLAIVIIALLIGAFGVLNTILMAVFERTREIGMMKAVGASRFDVFRLIWTETILVCLGGGVVGVGLALAAARGVEAFIRSVLPYAPRGALISFAPGLAALSLAFAVVLGMVAGFYPALRAASVRPIEAIRTE